VLAAVAALVLLVACSSGGTGDEAAEPAALTVPTPPPGGDRCSDVTGDLGESTKESGTLGEPAGIDLVETSAELTDAGLEVRFRVAGPPGSVPDPTFFVFQGPSGRAGSFEIQTELEAGSRVVTLITYDGTTTATRTTLPVPVVVEGDEVSYVVPPELVPPIVTRYWAWGSRAPVGAGVTLIDDCDPFAQAAASSTTTAP